MSLPERTVDMWVAAAVAAHFESARIWAPTQNDKPRNWDLATTAPGSKTVILENKGTVPNDRGTHRIPIDDSQLCRYLSVLEPRLLLRLYYVLPSPPWEGSPASAQTPVPEESQFRSASLMGGFEEWAYVLPARCLKTWLDSVERKSVNTSQLPTSIQQLRHSQTVICPCCNLPPWSLREFLEGLGGCPIGWVYRPERSQRDGRGRGNGAQSSDLDEAKAVEAIEKWRDSFASPPSDGDTAVLSPLAVTIPEQKNWG